MKFNKKIVVASLSTVMGLSLVGAITGVVAWYQYSTRATASFVATSVARSGVLSIGQKNNTSYTWGRDLSGIALTGSTNANKLSPVTFGEGGGDNPLPTQAYANPEAGYGRYTDWNNKGRGWHKATKGKEYVQFDVYLQATNNTGANPELVAKPVYLTDITLTDVDANNKHASEALRVHIAVSEYQNDAYVNTANHLIAKTTRTTAMYGHLDLDGNGSLDEPSGYIWDFDMNNPQNQATYLGDNGFGAGNVVSNGTGVYGTIGETVANGKVMYGTNGNTQTAKAFDDILCGRDADGNIYYMDGQTQKTDAAGLSLKKICSTGTNEDNPTKLTITIWLEGWHRYGNPESALWDPAVTASDINIGFTFDVGRTAFEN